MKIFITRRIPEAGINLLKEKGYDVAVSPYDRVLTREELLENVKGVDAILSLLTDKIDAGVLDAAGAQLKIVANYAVGYDNINLEDCKSKKVYATNTPIESLSNAVAEHTFTLMLAISHRIVESDKFMRTGKYIGWAPMLLLGSALYGKTLGIIGLGRIGSRVAMHAVKGFGMKVLYHDVKRNEVFEKEYGAVYSEQDDIFKNADYITLHVPLLPATKHLINKEKLEIMKPTAYLVNTSRGPVIDEAALVEALKNNKIKGAAIDVFEAEPKMAEGLAGLDNVIITPHIASATEECRSDMAIAAAQNIIDALEGKEPRHNLVK